MTSDLDIWHAGSSCIVSVKFKGQGYSESTFTFIGGKSGLCDLE